MKSVALMKKKENSVWTRKVKMIKLNLKHLRNKIAIKPTLIKIKTIKYKFLMTANQKAAAVTMMKKANRRKLSNNQMMKHRVVILLSHFKNPNLNTNLILK